MITEIIASYKELIDMLEKLRIRVSLGVSNDKKVVYDHEFLLIKDLLSTLII